MLQKVSACVHATAVRERTSDGGGLDERHPLDPCMRSERLVVDESRFVHPGACTVQLRRVAHVRLRLQPERGERNERHCRIPSFGILPPSRG